MMRKKLVNTALVIFSTCVALLLGEGIFRLRYNAMDVLSPELVPDDTLGHRIKPFSGGHDAWGFRNDAVPDSVDIAVFGDSQAWGVNATANESFPAQLAKLVNASVYNFGVSGYGLPHYQYLLEHRALQLSPSTVIAAVYTGNDFNDTYRLVYQKNYWANLRKALPDTTIDQNEFNPGLSYSIRHWLNHNSMLYRVSKNSFQFLAGWERSKDKNFIRYKNESEGIEKYFNPATRLSVMDHHKPEIAEGVRLALKCVARMDSICRANHIKLMVVIIPTDIMVYRDYLLADSTLAEAAVFNSVVESEQHLKKFLINTMDSLDVPYVDVLDALQQHTREEIYPPYEDGHPSARGYEIIAQAIARKLNDDN